MIVSAPIGSPLSLRLVRAHVWRAGLIWLSAHIFLALAGGEFAPLGVRATVITAAIALAVSMFDARRRRETGFLANLAVPWTIPSAVAVVTVIALELLSVGLSFALA